MVSHDDANTELDHDLNDVEAEIRRLDPDGFHWGRVIRQTYDQVYNGQDTGRYRWEELMKTEKTHFGSLFEINAQRKFLFESGDKTDFRIAGHEVDAKWSQKYGGWMLPPEVFGHIALVATGSDEETRWSLGLIRITDEVRRATSNRDMKSSLSADGQKFIRWIWKDVALPPNVLLQLPPSRVDFVFNPLPIKGFGGGTRRLYELFKEAEGRLVHRTSVETVAQQLDSQKRLRGNGGARDKLRAEGYMVLSGHYHKKVAADLGVPVPSRDEYISVRVVPSEDKTGALIEGRYWRHARPDETVTEPAPLEDKAE